MTEWEYREAICEAGRRMYAKNLAVATDGNISVRLGPDRFLCTPSGVSKGYMKPGDLLLADGDGCKIEGENKVTSEFYTHLAAYRERPDIQAVVHAHPPKTIALNIAGIPMTEYILPEVVYTLGSIPTSEYATPGTSEGAEVIRELIRECDAVILDRHGAITVGQDVFDALYRMEKIETAAETLYIAHLLGNIRQLDPGQIEKLHALRVAYNPLARAYSR